MKHPIDKPDTGSKGRSVQGIERLSRILINTVISAGLLIPLSLIVLAVVKSGYLDTRNYRVTGNTFLTADEVFEISKMKMGGNLYTTDLSKTEYYLESDPRISNATVYRRFPDTVIIEVEELRPVAVVNLRGNLYKVAGEGTVIAPLNGQYEDLPLLFGFEAEIEEGESPVGKKIAGEEVGLGLKVMSGLLSRPDFAKEVSSIRVDKRVMFLGNGDAFVRYDAGFDRKQVSRLALVWDIISEDGMLYELDLRYGNDVIVREL